MSLVEKALRKLQEAQGAPAVSPPVAQSRREPASASDLVVDALTGAREVRAPPAPRSDKLITVDRKALRSAGVLPPEAHERRFGSEYRQIKRPLIAAALGKGVPAVANGRVLMVASALPGDGKTFTSVNLALSLALEKDLSVILVDADLAKPHLTRVFGVNTEPGLLDVLRDGNRDVESVIIPTTVPGFSILPAGQYAESATELLASSRMEQVVSALASRDPRRIILFDSPPLVFTSESRVLAGVVGQVVLVVRAGGTPQQAVIEALSYLPENKPVGVILNQSESAPPDIYYGYGDYGDYGDARGSGA